MKQLYLIFTLTAAFQLSLRLDAQVIEDFVDGDYTNNPTWSGTVNAWTISNNQLRSNSTFSGSSPIHLSTASIQTSGLWKAYFRYSSMVPTSGNHSEFWIMSDNSDLTQAQNGYFIRIGDTDKDICLYSQVGGVATKIIDGPNQLIAANSNSGYVRLTRTAGNQFALWAININNSQDSLLMGTVMDEQVAFSTHLGILVKSTASNFGKHYFDDFIASGPAFPDQIPPSLLSASLLSPTEIEFQFDEPLDQNFAENEANYNLNPALTILSATLSQQFPKNVKLELASSLSNGIPYTVSVLQAKDLAGNIRTEGQSKLITYNPDAPYRSIVINEMMVNPISNATTTAPQVEWIELHNPRTSTITLNGWKIGDASGLPPKQIPLTTIPAGGYQILSAAANAALFPTIPFTAMVIPTLNNDKDSIVLSDSQGNPVDIVSYSDSWYRDPVKKAGGYSLEMIFPKLLCTVSTNWVGANAPSGGSPGAQNSTYLPNLDLEGPTLVSISFSTPTFLNLKFSKGLDAQFCSSVSLYNITPIDATIISAVIDSSDSTRLALQLSNELQLNGNYSITISAIKDQFCNLKLNQSSAFQYNTTGSYVDFIACKSVKLFPNPASKFVEIEIPSIESGVIEFFNSAGLKFESRKIKNNKSISVENLPSGIYHIRFLSPKGEPIGKSRLVIE